MESNKFISIIMPVYNSEHYLKQAIDSVLSQTYQNFELILLDDGSTDASGSMCDAAAQQDQRISVVHKQNEGICRTRNLGIQLAKGDYLYFMDNDDTIDPNALSLLMDVAAKYDPDLILFGTELVSVKDGAVRSVRNRNLERRICSSFEQVGEYYPQLLAEDMLVCVWDKFYKAELIHKNGVFFDPFFTHGGEDFHFNLQLIRSVNRLVNLPDVLYHYVIRDVQSTYCKFNQNTYEHAIKNLKVMIELQDTFSNQQQQKQVLYSKYVEYQLRLVLMLTRADSGMNFREKIDFCRNQFEKDGIPDGFRRQAFEWYFKTSKDSAKKKWILHMLYRKQYRFVLWLLSIKMG